MSDARSASAPDLQRLHLAIKGQYEGLGSSAAYVETQLSNDYVQIHRFHTPATLPSADHELPEGYEPDPYIYNVSCRTPESDTAFHFGLDKSLGSSKVPGLGYYPTIRGIGYTHRLGMHLAPDKDTFTTQPLSPEAFLELHKAQAILETGDRNTAENAPQRPWFSIRGPEAETFHRLFTAILTHIGEQPHSLEQSMKKWAPDDRGERQDSVLFSPATAPSPQASMRTLGITAVLSVPALGAEDLLLVESRSVYRRGGSLQDLSVHFGSFRQEPRCLTPAQRQDVWFSLAEKFQPENT